MRVLLTKYDGIVADHDVISQAFNSHFPSLTDSVDWLKGTDQVYNTNGATINKFKMLVFSIVKVVLN